MVDAHLIDLLRHEIGSARIVITSVRDDGGIACVRVVLAGWSGPSLTELRAPAERASVPDLESMLQRAIVEMVWHKVRRTTRYEPHDRARVEGFFERDPEEVAAGAKQFLRIAFTQFLLHGSSEPDLDAEFQALFGRKDSLGRASREALVRAQQRMRLRRPETAVLKAVPLGTGKIHVWMEIAGKRRAALLFRREDNPEPEARRIYLEEAADLGDLAGRAVRAAAREGEELDPAEAGNLLRKSAEAMILGRAETKARIAGLADAIREKASEVTEAQLEEARTRYSRQVAERRLRRAAAGARLAGVTAPEMERMLALAKVRDVLVRS